jgi:ADP-ribose pyrophosphatase
MEQTRSSRYVDDVRNTDNAWMETTCVNFHDEEGCSFSRFKLRAGDDAGDVAWTKHVTNFYQKYFK